MKILAFDPSTNCGWAFKNGKEIEFGTIKVPTKLGNNQTRLHKFFLEFQKLRERFNPDIIAFEKVNINVFSVKFNISTLLFLGEIIGIMKLVFNDKEILPYHNMTIFTTTGYKRSGKTHVKTALKKKISIEWARAKGFKVKNDNESDALLVLFTAIKHKFKPLPKKKRVFAKPAKKQEKIKKEKIVYKIS